MQVSRRFFIKTGVVGLVGGAIVGGSALTLLRNLARASADPEAGLDEDGSQKRNWAFVVDTTKCIGCGACVLACKLENGVPLDPHVNRTWVERYIITDDGEVLVDSPCGGRDGFGAEYENAIRQDLEVRKSFFVPKLCNQCDQPPCVRVCPVGATYTTDDGVTLIDRKHCIGCRYCIQACPYGARFFLHELGIVDKCTWCYHRITSGLSPACVEACPVGARVFGDRNDPQSSVRKLIDNERIYVLKPTLGTKPKVYYIGLEKGVR